MLDALRRRSPRLEGLVTWLWPVTPEYDPSPARRIWLLCTFTLRRWLFVDRSAGLAASLAVQTLLSVVPVVAVLLVFVRLVDPDFGREFVLHVAATLIPEGANSEGIAGQLTELGENASVGNLGVWGFFGVVVLAYWLYSTLERTCNTIWRVNRSRPLITQFTMFYTLASLAPVLVLYSLAQPMLQGVSGSFLVSPFITTSVGLILVNRFMPNTPVRWGPAILGGAVSALLFEASKWAFGIYVSRVLMATYENVYGSAALLPVFVVWSYLSWMIVLLGIELCYVVQHLPTVQRQGYVPPSQRGERLPPSAPGRMAARLMLAIADNFSRRKLGTSAEQLDERFDLGLGRIIDVVDRMEESGLIVAVSNDQVQGYVPGRPLEQISVLEVLDLFSRDLDRSRADTLGELFGRLDEHRDETLAGLDFAQLVRMEQDRGEGPTKASVASTSPEPGDPASPEGAASPEAITPEESG